MTTKFHGCLVVILLCCIIIWADENCPETKEKLGPVTCFLGKRHTFNPWGRKRSGNDQKSDTNHKQRVFNAYGYPEYLYEPSKLLRQQKLDSDTEMTRSVREFSSWGGKRLEPELTITEQLKGEKSSDEIFSCFRRFSKKKFILTRCIESAKTNCESGSCERFQDFQRRDFSAWGGW